MLEVAAAEAMILARIGRLETEKRPLAEAADRVLAEEIRADRDQPPFDRVTMDGIAVAFDDWASGRREFEVAGVQAAGAPPLQVTRPGTCIEVMTGAVRPDGTDTVIPVERVTRRGDTAEVDAGATVERGRSIHPRGSDRRADTLLLTAGQLIGPAEMAVLASAGQAEVVLARLPRVAVISTGDELVDVDEPVAPHQIRSSNDRAIEASLIRHRLGVVTRARLRDDESLMLDAIDELHAGHDVLVLSGGVSMGQYDFVPSVLERLGAELVFHRIAQRPGKPMWFGISRDAKPMFALPGNPVSTLVCLTRYVLPALRAARGETPALPERARLTADVTLDADLTYFMPVVLGWSPDGETLAEPRPTNTSGDFISLAGTDGFVELPRERRTYAAGNAVRVYRW